MNGVGILGFPRTLAEEANRIIDLAVESSLEI
jgi:hypothetical protein